MELPTLRGRRYCYSVTRPFDQQARSFFEERQAQRHARQAHRKVFYSPWLSSPGGEEYQEVYSNTADLYNHKNAIGVIARWEIRRKETR